MSKIAGSADTLRSGLDRHEQEEETYVALQQELKGILEWVNTQSGTPRARYNAALVKCKARKKRGLTALFRATVDVPVGGTPIATTAAEEALIKKFELLGKLEPGVTFAAKVQRTPEKDKPKMATAEQIKELENRIAGAFAQKFALVSDEMSKLTEYCKGLEGALAVSQEETKAANEKADRLSAEQQIMKGESRTTSNTVTTTLANLVTNKDAIPSKLQPYKSGNFHLWAEKFENHTENWDEPRKLRELINLLGGKAEDVVVGRARAEWTSEELLKECKKRITPGMSRWKMELLLKKIEPEPYEDPDDTMDRIEAVMRKGASTFTTAVRNKLKFNAFMRLVEENEPLYSYIMRKKEKEEDPGEALDLARKYADKHGDSQRYNMKTMQKILGKSGVIIPDINIQACLPNAAHRDSLNSALLNPAPISSQLRSNSTPNLTALGKATVNSHDVGKQLQSESVCHYADLECDIPLEDVDVMPRYFEKGYKPTAEELGYRANDTERFKRDFKFGKIWSGYGNDPEWPGRQQSYTGNRGGYNSTSSDYNRGRGSFKRRGQSQDRNYNDNRSDGKHPSTTTSSPQRKRGRGRGNDRGRGRGRGSRQQSQPQEEAHHNEFYGDTPEVDEYYEDGEYVEEAE